MYAVIQAGGAGTRLWPLSRRKKPKQFLALTGGQSLLVESVERLLPLIPEKDIFVGTTSELLPECRRLLPKLPRANFFVEPVGKNTGPAVGLAAALLSKRDPEAVIAILWSDHHIGRPQKFRDCLSTAAKVIQKHPEALVTIGITPTEPSIAYGYIRMTDQLEKFGGQVVQGVRQFVEKPDEAMAKHYVSSGKYLWNAGYFIFRAKTMLDLFKDDAPTIYAGLQKIVAATGTSREATVLKHEYGKFSNVPFDTLIAEKAPLMYVIQADLDWSDIGSWASLHDILSLKNGLRTVVHGDHIGHGSEDVFVHAGHKLVATVGLKNVIVVDTPDALLVMNKNRSQDIKPLLEKLKEKGKERYL